MCLRSSAWLHEPGNTRHPLLSCCGLLGYAHPAVISARPSCSCQLNSHLAAQGDARIAEVSALLEEAGGAVRIEDILPFFPDFVEIGAFKEAICRCGREQGWLVLQLCELVAGCVCGSVALAQPREGTTSLGRRAAWHAGLCIASLAR